MCKDKKIILISVSIITTVLLLTSIVFALFIITDNSKKIKYNLGNLKFEIEGSFNNDYIYPGINLLEESFTIKNKSNIKTQIRLKYKIEIEQYPNLAENAVITNINGVLIDDYYYFNTVDTVFDINEEVILIDSIELNGEIIKTKYSGKEFSLYITIEAKQYDYVTWVELGTRKTN